MYNTSIYHLKFWLWLIAIPNPIDPFVDKLVEDGVPFRTYIEIITIAQIRIRCLELYYGF